MAFCEVCGKILDFDRCSICEPAVEPIKPPPTPELDPKLLSQVLDKGDDRSIEDR